MQVARWVRTKALLVLGIVGLVAGCGSGAKRGPTEEEKATAKAVAADMRNFHDELKSLKKAGPRSKPAR
jgi:hypothetical protein